MVETGPLQKLEKKVDCLSRNMRTKVPWVGAGVIVACLTVIALLTYEAYSGEQQRQCDETKENSAQVQELRTNVKVMQTQFTHVRDKLQDLKDAQENQTEAILHKLDQLSKEKGGTD